MPWIIGIDEAGYGPNLGPLVMTAVAHRVPAELATADLWQVLRSAVRRGTERADERLLIADSKQVYTPARGLLALETGVLATVAPWTADSETTLLSGLVEKLCPSGHDDLRRELWYTGRSPLPLHIDGPVLAALVARYAQACRETGLSLGPVHSVIVCPSLFNQLADRDGSKGAVLGHALGQLVQCALRDCVDEDVISFFIDKHGGRNRYAPLLQDAVTDGVVMAHEESMNRSAYRVLGLDRDVRFTFEPRADDAHYCVALASMVSKYLREIFMGEYNHFWQQHVPNLTPTAGYPGDATRFMERIRPAMQKLGIAESAVWRRR
jgi:ribonuclease HII